jgi:threonine/homoserine/homoserine lactone efflux protein
MFGTQNLGIFLIAAISLNLVPGQDTLYILGRSLSQGREAGIVSVVGLGTGCIIHILAATIGLYSLLALSPLVFTAVCLAGGLYLIWLGIMAFAGRKEAGLVCTFRNIPGTKWQIYRQGLLTNLLNPKAALFFLAFLPQFVDPVSDYGSLSFLFLGLIFLCTGTLWCMIIAVSASRLRERFSDNPKIQCGFAYLSCIVFTGLGAIILLGHF